MIDGPDLSHAGLISQLIGNDPRAFSYFRERRLCGRIDPFSPEKILHVTLDLITDSSDFLCGKPLRVPQRPVVAAQARDIRTLVPASHCDEKLGFLC